MAGETSSPMEQFLKNPGLVHLAENIFNNLNDADVEICQNINQISKEILDNPMFWLRKFGNLSQKNQNNWIKDIQSIKNSEKKKAITSYLQWKLKKEALVDLPCYSSPEVQDDFRNKIWEIIKKKESSNENTEIVKILASLTDNPNAPDKYGVGGTPIHRAALYGHTEIVKILAPLTNNPNASNRWQENPIYLAAKNGHTEIVKILAPLIDNPNAPNNFGNTPIHLAEYYGHTEIVTILAPLSDNYQ